MTFRTGKHGQVLFWLLLSVGALVLFLCNLGNHYLWQDEAQTALVSKTILTYGVPKGYDGKNYFSQELGAEYGEDYKWKWHTWLSFYVLAGFFKVFGVTTFVARLPFALFGMASVFMTYTFCLRLWGSRKTAAIAAVLLLFSVTFLILSRQCRYYSMTAFFSLMSLHAYLGILEKKKASYALFVIGATLLFNTHYIFCATLVATVLLHALLFHPHRLLILILLSIVVVLINSPWIIWFSSIKYGERYEKSLLGSNKLWLFSQGYLYIINRSIFPFYLLLLIPLAAFGLWRKTGTFISKNKELWQRGALLLLFILVNFVVMVVVSPYPFLRYFSPLVPIFIMLLALLLRTVARLHWLIVVVLVGVWMYLSSFTEFIYEITHDYDSPIEGIVLYLNENADADDVVLISYGDLPLKFYTPFRVIGGITGENLKTPGKPDWIIIRKNLTSSLILRVIRYVNTISLDGYEKIPIDYPDIMYNNREDPTVHHFRTVEDEDRVVIYRRIK